ncbi:hypothetical protein H4219_003061 [Mycoemilia scoparia]|uniref:Uncharacterized protein n=1 Tax=Mycoemilia scoparia TaxID=417184 RepID=A0A9W7ZVY0_9FUNG|nr:hypothetical protein H4219_003061 [Mycoemilia scoparia]
MVVVENRRLLYILVVLIAQIYLSITACGIPIPYGAKKLLNIAEDHEAYKVENNSLYLGPLLDYAEAIECPEASTNLKWNTMEDTVKGFEVLMKCTMDNLEASIGYGEMEDSKQWGLLFNWIYHAWYVAKHSSDSSVKPN